MNAQTFQTEPTLEQRLRFIDLTFECSKQAQAIVGGGPALPDEVLPTARGKAIGLITRELRLEAMNAEGLPLSLLGEGAPEPVARPAESHSLMGCVA